MAQSSPRGGPGSAKPCTHEGRAQYIAPASGQDAMCCVTRRNVRLSRGTLRPRHRALFILRLRQTIHDQEVTMVQLNRSGDTARPPRRTLNSTEFPKLKLTMSLGKFCGPNKGSLSLCQGICEPEPEYWFKFTPVGKFPLAHQGDKRGATLPHKPITPFQIESFVCGLTAAPCP